MTAGSARTAMQAAIDQIDHLIRDQEAQLAKLRSVRDDLHRQLHVPRATRQCACGAPIPQAREMLGHTMCFRCEVTAMAEAGNAVRQAKRDVAVMRNTCQAHQHSDQMMCGPCGLAWDINDPAPPSCRIISRLQSVKSKGDSNE